MSVSLKTTALAAILALGAAPALADNAPVAVSSGEMLPTGQRITPLAAAGAVFSTLNPNLPDLPDFVAGQAVETALSPDGATLLILTSGYNRNVGADGKYIPALSNEYVFVYDVSGREPVKKQALQLPNTFYGMVWLSEGDSFAVGGGVDDNVHFFKRGDKGFAEDGEPLKLGHPAGVGVNAKPSTAGLAVDPERKRLLVANLQNDSVTLIDLAARKIIAEQDLRPGKIDPADAGKPGGTFPLSVVFVSPARAYVSSQRDRELTMLTIGEGVKVRKRIALAGQPNKMITTKDRKTLYVAIDNSDTVAAIDAKDGDITAQFPIAAPAAIFLNPTGLHGANPNNLALSPDERTLFVTNGGLNAVAVVQIGRDVVDDDDGDTAGDDDDDKKFPAKTRVVGLIPTGWYPNAVAVAKDGRHLYVVNGKSNSGPNVNGCRENTDSAPAAVINCRSKNEYVWQTSKAGFLTLPTPSPRALAGLTLQAAENNNFPVLAERQNNSELMAFLHAKIKHVVYIVKENRTYDQVLGDLPRGNGDPSLTLFPQKLTPNHHALAENFVTLDNFFDSGETSNTGWVWTTAARTTDFTEKEAPVNYADRGLNYDQEGGNRNINVALPSLAERRAANPATPNDPDVLAGTADVGAPDAPGEGGEAGTGYLWDGALRAGLTIRNYGFYGDLSRYFVKDDTLIPLVRDPFAEKRQVFFPAKTSLTPHTDIYYRGYDQAFPDFYLVKEWRREFAEQVAAGKMPNLTLMRVPHDHFGQFAQAIDGVNTIETQMADNDYAIGSIVETIAKSPFGKDTLVFIVEDDAQNGADHVDAHRSIAFVAGPYVAKKALVSRRYTTVNMLRTIEDVLGVAPLGLNDGLAEPMTEVFDVNSPAFAYEAETPAILRSTQLPLPPEGVKKTEILSPTKSACYEAPRRDMAYWAQAMAGQNFLIEDHLDVPKFNAALWTGLKGDKAPQPQTRSNADLREGREALIAAARLAENCQ